MAASKTLLQKVKSARNFRQNRLNQILQVNRIFQKYFRKSSLKLVISILNLF